MHELHPIWKTSEIQIHNFRLLIDLLLNSSLMSCEPLIKLWKDCFKKFRDQDDLRGLDGAKLIDTLVYVCLRVGKLTSHRF